MDTDQDIEQDEARVAQIEAAMLADGISPEHKVPVDYFDFTETRRVALPDGVQWVEHKLLSEGNRRAYLNKTNRDVRFNRASGDAIMKMSPGDNKKALLQAAVVGWNLYRGGEQIAFSPRELEKFLDLAPPKIIDLIEADIVKANDWLVGDLTIEEIDKEIENLNEQRTRIMEAEEGKDSSKSK